MNIEQKIDELIRIIYDSREFQELQRTKRHLLTDKELAYEVREFQQNQNKILQDSLSGKDVSENFNNLNRNFADLLKSKEVMNYIKAVENLNKKINFIDKSICEKLEKDIVL